MQGETWVLAGPLPVTRGNPEPRSSLNMIPSYTYMATVFSSFNFTSFLFFCYGKKAPLVWIKIFII